MSNETTNPITTDRADSPALTGSAASAPKWKVGDMARYVTRDCTRVLILEAIPDNSMHRDGLWRYCGLNSGGTVNYYAEYGLKTLDEWLEWWERFQDETTGMEYRERQEAARLDFVPPVWWPEAVERATAPYRQSDQALRRESL